MSTIKLKKPKGQSNSWLEAVQLKFFSHTALIMYNHLTPSIMANLKILDTNQSIILEWPYITGWKIYYTGVMLAVIVKYSCLSPGFH